MKHFIQRRFFPVFLCMALALSLTSCGGRGNQPAGDKTGDTAGTLSGSKGEKDSGAGVASGSGEETAEADLESAEASLDLLYDVVQISLASCVGDNGDQQKGTAHDHKGNDSLYRHGITLFGLFAPYLIGTFTDSREVISIGAATLRALMIMLPFVGTTTVIRSTFNAMGKPMFAFGITIVRQLVLYIPFLLLFNQIWGFNGLIHAQPTEEIVCMIFALWLISNRLKKIRS